MTDGTRRLPCGQAAYSNVKKRRENHPNGFRAYVFSTGENISVRNHPLTAPAIMPLTSLSCMKMNRIIIGRTESVRQAMIMPVSEEYCPW